MKNKITRHLREADMGYFQHMLRACTISATLFLAFALCMIHAFIPFLFERSASKVVKNLSKKI